MKVLVVNAGSSSLKLRLLGDADEVLGSADLPATADGFDAAALSKTLAEWPAPDAVGHRVVHGGTVFTGPTLILDDVELRIEALTDLAPLHQPKSLAGLRAVATQLPDVPAVACFDTAFHAGLPAEAATYAVPRQWRDGYGVRRFGFHGLSHAYASRRAAELSRSELTGSDLTGSEPARSEHPRIVSCHLGAGASLCAVVGGRSVDTTMGFTPLEGLVMATRSGTVDPGLVLWLQRSRHLPAEEIDDALEHRSGLLALAGTGDLKEIITRVDAGDAEARLAFDVYLHRLAGSIAAMAAAAGGLDVLLFTGGVGEHAPAVRRAAAERLAWLGVGVDEERNRAADGDTDITARTEDGTVPDGRVQVLVVAAREDLQIAGEVRALLQR